MMGKVPAMWAKTEFEMSRDWGGREGGRLGEDHFRGGEDTVGVRGGRGEGRRGGGGRGLTYSWRCSVGAIRHRVEICTPCGHIKKMRRTPYGWLCW